jgi:1-acyl-sn-glycerol-3-phosphate acyltransferase
MGTLITLILTLLVIGFILWLINTYIPLQPPFKTIINVVVVIAVIIWLVHKYLPSVF